MRPLLLAVLIACISFAQTFEVATIKPAAPRTATGIPLLDNAPGSFASTPGRINYKGVNLHALIERAFDALPEEVDGPAWLDSARFDITATMPADTSPAALQKMLQNLLADRFKMRVHRDIAASPVYLLSVAKSGPKLKPEIPATAYKDDAERRAAENKRSKEDLAIMQARVEAGDMTVHRILTQTGSMADFVKVLSRFSDRPVLDRTQLTDRYQFRMDYVPDGQMAKGPNGSDGPHLREALEQQLGLRLEAAKADVDTIVVDSMEKVPTEN